MAKILQLLAAGQGGRRDADDLLHIADSIPGGLAICAFGDACSWPVQSTVQKFKEQFVARGAEAEARRAAQRAASAASAAASTPGRAPVEATAQPSPVAIPSGS